MLLRVNHGDRSAFGREARGSSLLVLRKAEFEIVGLANVERVVSAAKDIDEVHAWTTMPSSVRGFKVGGEDALRLGRFAPSLRAFDKSNGSP